MTDKEDRTINNTISIKASECPVTKVTVYKDRAEVCREINTTVKPGINELRIKEFVCIDEESIRVEGKGAATIAEVSFQSKYVTEDQATMSEKEKALNDQLRSLTEEKKALDLANQKEILNRQWKVLDQFAATAAKSGQVEKKDEQVLFKLDDNYFKGMKEFMKEYKAIGKQLENERLDLERKNEELDRKIEAVERNLNDLRGNYNTGHENRECIVVLEAEKEDKVYLVVSYVVMGASWIPSYDLRMFTEEGSLKIFYYGLIYQNSGEDWNDVKLYLSTAEPSVGGTIPNLPMTQLAIRKPIEVDSTQSSQQVVFSDIEMEPFSLPLEYSVAQVSESTTSTTYEIARQSTIPSDNTEHKVTVAIIELKPTLSYLSVPKVVPHAFLQAKVVNNSPYTLLSGRTNIFLDNSFVAKAEIKAVAPKEEFECSLGVDPSIRVDYKPLNKVSSQSGLISKSNTTTYEQNIEIKNLHNYAIKIVVRDNLPRSLDEKIKVTLLLPQIDNKHPEKNEKVKLTKSNHLEWDLDIKEMDKVDLVLKYAVEHPASEDVETTLAIGN
ncbi:protein F37C4.5-like isoform X5 [Biomphalaria glabrata]|uniref:Protein F37C4.5-like isoform X5 n=1 Tax=Biomphalaria glabrata TaxID=6526 RepID=A0A9W3AKF9_BIOGL|nr:protein F37C4.5-like isoform X5 [Biomphalaria glabrata]